MVFFSKFISDLVFIIPLQALTEEESVPKLAQGDTLPVKELKLSERQTSPPDYLTESDLITLMEK